MAAVVGLLGHVLGSAVIFLGVAAVSWALGYAVEWLHRIHPFPASVFSLLHNVELVLLYVDIALSGYVLLMGAIGFVRELASRR